MSFSNNPELSENIRAEFVRESTYGTTPTDPGWILYSDTVIEVSDTPDLQYEEQRGIDSVAPVDHRPGSEDATLSVNYFLQQWLIDGGSNAQDASYDGVTFDADGLIPNSHSIVIRKDRAGGGAASSGIRDYTVAKGAKPTTTSFELDAGSGNPIPVTMEYDCRKVRRYKISQPSSSVQLDVESTDAADTSQTLTIEDEGAGTTEAVSLSGTSTQTTTASFADIDAAELDAETVGDVLIKDQSGNELMRIEGTDSLPDGYEGDLGVPALGSGSHDSAFGSAYEIFRGDTVERPSSTTIAENVVSGTLEFTRDVSKDAQSEDQSQTITEGNWTGMFTGTVHGEDESFQQFLEHLTETENNFIWTADGGSIQLDSAAATVPTEKVYATGQDRMDLDIELQGQGVTIS